MLNKNVKRRIYAAAFLFEKALGEKSTNNKSSYYRSILILLYSVVEGLVYELVKESTHHNSNILFTKKDYRPIQVISGKAIGIQNDLVVCEKVVSDVKINDNGVDFGKLNNYAKNNKLISDRQYKLIDWVRTERNKIHLQGLEDSDIGYNKRKMNKTADVISFLLDLTYEIKNFKITKKE